jgi:hypothetical protein
MKSVNAKENHLLRTTTMPQEPGRHRVSDDLKERIETDAVLSASFFAIVALSVAMFVGLYSWSHRAPVFSPDHGVVPTVEKSLPWSA